MIRNFFKLAWRKLKRNRGHAVINILGLAAALSFVLLITAFIWTEVMVDADIKNIDRQYLLQSEINELTSSGMLARSLKEEYPALVENYFRYDGITAVLYRGSSSFQKSAIIGDSTFFDMFGFELLHGDVHTALSQPYQVVLHYETAIHLFGNTDAVGKQVDIANFSGEKQLFTISGVLKPLPHNSVTHLIADSPSEVILPLLSTPFFRRSIDQWTNPYIASYIMLKPGVHPDQLQEPIQQLIQQHLPEDQQAIMKTKVVPLATYHLNKADGTVKRMLYTLGIVGAFILLMAGINFVNLTVNNAITRIREIGVRKVMGSSIGQLRLQFLTESVLIVGIAGLIGITLYPLLSDMADSIFAKPLPSMSQLGATFWFYALAALLGIGLIAGLYPAFRLASYRIVESVKGKLPASVERTLIMKGLVGTQVGIAMVVLIATTVIISQIQVFFGANLGYDKDYLVTAQVPRNWSEDGLRQTMQIRDLLQNSPGVESITLSYDVPGAMNSGDAQFTAHIGSGEELTAGLIAVDKYYAGTYRIPLLAGQFFSTEEANINSMEVVINETFARMLGYKDPAEAIAKTIYFSHNETAFTIAGVSGDIYRSTMQVPPGPVLWMNVNLTRSYRYFTIRLHPDDVQTNLATLHKTWKTLMPDAPFDYQFVDERLQTIYKTEIQLKQTGTAAAILAIVIVILGMIGLISQNLNRRTKEIGIRKVLGASVGQIILLFIRDLSLVFLIAMLVAVPFAYLVMQNWLDSYYLKTTIDIGKLGWPVLALVGLTIILTISQTWRTAMANPVDSLRDE